MTRSKRKVPKRSPTVRPKRSPGARKRAPRPIGADARRVAAAVKRFEQAYRVAGSRADDLAALAHGIGEAAAAKQRTLLARDCAERQLLRDVVALREAFADLPAGALPAPLEPLRLLPDALLQWMEQRLDLEPVGQAGELKELPAAKLANYAYNFEKPADPATLVRVRVAACGWKHGAAVLIPPQVVLAPA